MSMRVEMRSGSVMMCDNLMIVRDVPSELFCRETKGGVVMFMCG